MAQTENRSIAHAEALAFVVSDRVGSDDLEFLNQIIDSVADPIFVKDERLAWIFVNQAFCDFIGHPREALLGRTDADLFPAAEAAVFNRIDRQVLDSGTANVNEELLTNAASGEQRTIRTTKTMFFRPNGARILVGIFTDLTVLRDAQHQLEQANELLRHQALHDPLTALPNRRALERALDRTLALAERHGEAFALLFLDLNGFKQVNDTHGHDAGDELIQHTATRITAQARSADFVARLGGDEFVMLARMTDTVDAGILARRLGEALSRPVPLAIGEVSVSTSIGVARYPEDGRTRDVLLRRADKAMYHAKRVLRQSLAFAHEVAEDA
ncbi:MAG: diguanylate cyclase [Pseudomonadota bacterium]